MTIKNSKGFTLIEVIVSIAALGIICAILLKLFVLAGDANRRAGDIQEAQVAVTSVAETFAGAGSVDDGLERLNVIVSDGSPEGRYNLAYGSFSVVLDISRDPGKYPGKLFDFDVKAVSGGKELAKIQTSKYYGDRAHD